MQPVDDTAVADAAIRARGLTKHFGELVAVDALDLTVRRGEVYGFLGPNGSGKSTTIRMLCGLLKPSAGDIDVLGCSIPRDAEKLKRRIGYMTQRFSLTRTPVAENLGFLAAVHDGPGTRARQTSCAAIGRPGAQTARRTIARVVATASLAAPC
jgi:ABC-2 type transport system ATP-binding protein